MPMYYKVLRAAGETTEKILRHRSTAGRQYSVTVRPMGGTTASVKWNHSARTVDLNLPSLPADSMLSRAEADRIVGFVAHECCHVIHTDWLAWETAVMGGSRLRLWTNALEDVRIEKREIKAGAFPALKGLLSTVMDNLHYRAITEGAPTGRIIGATLADAPYCAAVLGRVRNGYTVPSASRLAATLHPTVAALIDTALARLPACRSTGDVVTLARQLMQLEQAAMEAAAPPPPPPPPQQKPQEAPQDDQDAPQAPQTPQAPQDDQDAPQAPQAPQDDQDAPQAPQAPQDGQDGDGQDGADTGNSQGPGPGPGPGDPNSLTEPLDPSETLRDVTAKVAAREGLGDLPEDPGMNNLRNEVMRPYRNPSDHDPELEQALTRALPRAAVLHGQISRMLVAPEQRHVTHRETSGRLDRRALARIRTGAIDVFSRKHETPGTDTALLVLIDGSGSMSLNANDPENGPQNGDDSRIAIAGVTAWHIGLAAEAAGAKAAIWVFFTNPNCGAGPHAARGAKLLPLIPFGMPMKGNGHTLKIKPRATTPLSPAIVAAAEALSDIQAARHILLVLTDGACNYGYNNVKSACRIAEHLGVETVALGMACPTIVAAFPDRRSVNVPNVAELGRVGMGVLADLLEDPSLIDA